MPEKKKIRLVSLTIFPDTTVLKVIIGKYIYEYSTQSPYIKHLLIDALQEVGRPLTFRDINKVKKVSTVINKIKLEPTDS